MEKIRIAMIGCGGIARWHMTNLAKIPEVEIVALVDPNEDQIAQTKTQHPHLADVPVYRDHKEALKSVDCDAVEINSRHSDHFEQVIDSFAGGKHVFVEKPFVMTVDEANRCIEARDRSGKVGLLAYQRHTQAEFKLIRRKIQSGEFGKVQFVAALLCQEWNKFTKGSWRQDPSLSGGGMLNDSGSHILDAILWTTGLDVSSVSAYSDNRSAPVELNSATAFKLSNGAPGTISIVGDAQHWHEEFTIWCEKGAFFIRNNKITVVEADGTRATFDELRGGSNPNQNFVDAILGRDEVHSPFESGIGVLAFTKAINDSAAKNA